MLNSLRSRLTLSHILPVLIVIPLMGIALIYVMETQVLLAKISDQLAGDAGLLAHLAASQPETFESEATANDFLAPIDDHLASRVMLVTVDGRLLASSDSADAGRVGQVVDLPALPDALAGETVVSTRYSRNLDAEVADVLTSVRGPDGQVIGVLRLTHRLGNVYQDFLRVRFLIAAILVIGLLLGIAVGYILAESVGRPLQKVTRDVYEMAGSQQLAPLEERGLQEVQVLLRAFNSLVERLKLLEQNRRQLLANLVHEIGRPLGALQSAVQALQGGADEDPELRGEMLSGIQTEVRTLNGLLDDLAQLYDRDLGRLELNRQPIDLNDWLPSTLAPWHAVALDRGLRWEVALPDALPVVRADSNRLAQVLGNLLSNAIKYTSPGGTVSVDSGTAGQEVWIRVGDTGPGIPAEEQELIFTPMYRGHWDRRFPQGMGVGLSIARGLVVAHGGRLEVDSAPGLGSKFSVWLPLE